MKATIIGFGAIGHAIKSAILDNGIIVNTWDKKDQQAPNLAEVVLGSNIIFLCVPSFAVRETLEVISTSLDAETIVVSLSKGFEEKSGKFIYELGHEYVSSDKFGMLCGPMLAEEILEDKGGAGVIAGLSQDNFDLVKSIIDQRKLRIEYSADIKGVALMSVLKNIYSIGLGICSGLGYGMNIHGLIVSRSIKEFELIAQSFGVNQSLVLGMEGLGDFVATGFSPLSSNRAAGLALTREADGIIQCEGLTSLPHLVNKLQIAIEPLPVLEAIIDIVINLNNPKIVMNKLIYDQV